MYEFYELFVTYVNGIWRHRWYLILVAWLVSIIGWGIVYQLPDQYEAKARVNVNTQSMLQPLLRGLTVATNTQQRIQLVTRTLLSRPNLEKLARMTDLDLLAQTPSEMDVLLDDLADDIKLTGSRDQDLYTISYLHHDRQLAKLMVQSLLTIFVESTLGENRADTDSAQVFVGRQIKEYEAKLEAAEMRLSEFKRTHVGMMPGSAEDYYSQLKSAQASVQQAKLSLREAQSQRKVLLEQMEEDEDSYLMYSGLMPDSGSALDIRIQGLEERMDELLLNYTEKHPDVISIRDLIAVLEQRREEERALRDELDMGPTDNPLYQQMKLQVSQADALVSTMRTRVDEYQQRVTTLQEMVDTIPKVEAEFKQLNRDYGVIKNQYNSLLERREAANIAEQAELSGDQIRFRVVDPPRVPVEPAAPNRPLLMTVVLIVGLLAGAVLALLLYLINPTFDNSRTVMDVVGVPVLGAVSMIHGLKWERKQRYALVAYSLAVMSLLALYGGVMAADGLDLNIAVIQKAVVGRG
ncbi:MAG: Wzz/FepE/Etk N-terminal domain-containing protein [Gammaproteobacteria bacterium]|nr:MAG: Wzz/FepE/Etk N-terminal domain-containing protein [Gammaproteobacteria bacterium]